MSFLNEQDQEFEYDFFAGFGHIDAAAPSYSLGQLGAPSFYDTNVIDPQLQLQTEQLPQLQVPAPAPALSPAPAPKAASAQNKRKRPAPGEWENSNPNHRFNPNGPFNFAPQIPQGTSDHPESVKRRRIVGKKSGLAAALFRLKESGRSRKRHRKTAIKKTKAYLEADDTEKERLLAEADETSARELAAKIAACTNAWNDLSPEAQQAHMTRAPNTEVAKAPLAVEAELIRPAIAIRTGATNAPKPAHIGGPSIVPVELKSNSRGIQLFLPADLGDIEPELIAEAMAEAMPFASAAAGRKRPASEEEEETQVGGQPKAPTPKKRRVEVSNALLSTGSIAAAETAATIPPSRAVARADEIPVEVPFLPQENRDTEAVESQMPGRSCLPQGAPKLPKKRAASAIRHIIRSKIGEAGAAGMVIPPGPLEPLREQDLNARAEWDAAQFMKHPTYRKWELSQKRKRE
ncbi:hypothetical protein TWF718_010927 [Orbilia javanica]|uniref:Uncharacterized protein n=1 Tax=Orbilia javanica TaxID=47235 RepID=A0AAN8RD08_9PEZI